MIEFSNTDDDLSGNINVLWAIALLGTCDVIQRGCGLCWKFARWGFFQAERLTDSVGHDRHNSFWNSWANNFVSFKDMFLKATIHVSRNILG